SLCDVTTFSSRWFKTEHLIQRRRVIFGELFSGEAGVTDNEVQVGVTINTEIDFTAFDVFNCLCHVWCNSTGTWVRHQVSWTQNFAETSNLAHHVRRSNGGVEISPAALNTFNQVIRPNILGAGFFSGSCVITGCKYDYT